ncbi:MAG TPA: hypothetical protein PK867_05330 [Pirellulales bacterium]|nr:hypothetical protein [Pirellulales bacterium]
MNLVPDGHAYARRAPKSAVRLGSPEITVDLSAIKPARPDVALRHGDSFATRGEKIATRSPFAPQADTCRFQVRLLEYIIALESTGLEGCFMADATTIRLPMLDADVAALTLDAPRNGRKMNWVFCRVKCL